ncbi:MAG TPA: ABC-2 transporter permease [Rhodanobacter sp.]|nr:ABC-2 transporter permease [Rhodanobacter sp.]
MKTFYWLVKREFWEHQGSFLWAPVITGGIMLLLTLMGITAAEVFRMRSGVQINGIDFNAITAHMDADALAKLGQAFDVTILLPAVLIGIVMFVVIFFYCLGSLYDDRRDRSILFWKSLPISDRDTVLSKVACAALLAPAIAIVTSVVTGLLMLILMTITASLHGANLWQMLTLAHPFRVTVNMLGMIPLYAVWALPTVGWLMFCSAWARNKPFLWALIIPVGSGVVVSWFNLMGLFSLSDSWFWGNVVGRALLSLFPGSWVPGQIPSNVGSKFGQMAPDNHRIFGDMLDLSHNYAALVSPQFLIGAAAGLALLAGAIWFRRWRDDS